MSEQEYWFARSARPGSGRMRPVHWKGWAVVAFFVASMLVGAGLFGYFMYKDHVITGVTLYALCAAIGAGVLIKLSLDKGDRVRTVADYRKRARRDEVHDQLGGRR